MKKRIVITDIGSTTTKAILLVKEDDKYHLKGLANAVTTVEKPFEDVKIGVYNSIKDLEKREGISLFEAGSSEEELKFLADVDYLTTSSAGGGLQILVVGLTLFDSAKSAERAAFGAGGVLLDTIAINDKRSTVEQLDLINSSHPDIILFSGGTDGGAFSGVIRLAETLALGKPSPKFSINGKVPLIYAGNVEAQDFVKTLFGSQFDLSILPNMRPTMSEEVLEPSTEKIHELFLSSVMEEAPGYVGLKKHCASDIQPTPVAVLNAVDLIKDKVEESVMKVDIGGATTDIFSVIHDKTYRTVSANYGMSYSISNVMAQSGIDRLLSLLPTSFAEDMVRDYVGNKMLNPGYVPEIDSELCIEQALAITALELSMKQHLDMHFNTVEIGFLDKVKSFTRDPFYDQMYQEKVLEGKRFHHSDVKLIIGAGGVISHAPKREQALYMMLRGFRAEGVTEVWRDNNFISPHLGKLSDVDEGEAFRLLMEECYEKLGTVINPSVKSKRMNRKVMTATIDGVKISLNKNEVRYLPIDKKVSVEIVLEEEATIRGIDKVIKFETDFPLLLMTYSHRDLDFSVLMNELKLYNFSDESFHIQTKTFALKNYIEEGDFELSLDLPYKGSILFEKGDKVTSDQIYGVNKFALPKLYIISLTKLLGNHFDSNMMRNQLMLRVGDFLDFDQQIMGMAHSPIKGVIKSINYDTGTILAQEIQDYTEKPITINFAKRLNIKPKSIYGYLKKGKNDFVFEGERLNKLNSKSATTIIKAPITGNLVDIDSKKGTVTIQYKITPNEHKIGLNCEVTDVREYMGLDVKYSGSRVQGKIGFGKQMNGELIYCSNLNDITAVMKKVVVYNGKVDSKILKRLEKAGIHGLVIPTISNRELVEFISEEIGIALTGKEKIQFPLILMKGFGEASFDDDFLELVKNSEGKSALLLPITQIRAGVTRPTIIIT